MVIKMKKHIVSYSGGAGSIMTAIKLVEKYGNENVLLLFADTMIEHEDLYVGNSHITKLLNVDLEIICKGKTPWEVFADVCYQGNTRVDPCSRVLKREFIARWLKYNCQPDECIVYVGIDCSEEHRLPEIQARNLPFVYRSILIENDIFIDRSVKRELYRAIGLPLPELYAIGLAHNNCSGFCVKAGLGHYYLLYKYAKYLYLRHEESQEKLIAENPKLNRPFLRKTTNKKLRYITLKQYREEFLEPELVSEYEKLDFGGCGCVAA